VLLTCVGIAAMTSAGLDAVFPHAMKGRSLPNPPAAGSAPPSPSTPTPARVPSTAPSSPVPVLPFAVFDEHDVSVGSGAMRLAVRVELRRYPVTENQLIAVAARVVEQYRGHGWQALHISIMFDRREALPSFATLVWAPGGLWEDASNGDARTWQGYQLHIDSLRDKIRHPQSCTVPSARAYLFDDEFNQANDANPDAPEATVLAQIAKRHGLSMPVVERDVSAVETWTT
jgi:hypothetical protein